jgi:hypothetical protein
MTSVDLGGAPVPTSRKVQFACSPSNFFEAEACPLKYVRDGTPAMPSLPWHIHGTVVHRLIASPPANGDFETAYDDCLARLVAEPRPDGTQDPWLSTYVKSDHAGRCSIDLPDFAVRRASGIALARRYARERRQPGGSGAIGPGEHEVRVSVDLINATIDALSEEDGLLIVTDFKTGSIRERGVADSGIKPQYRAQLLIYAAMVHATSGRWPDRIRLIGPDGECHEESIDRAEAKEFLVRCIQLRKETEMRLEQGREDELARGFDSAACVTCGRRDRCPRLIQALRLRGFMAHDSGRSGLLDLEGCVVAPKDGHARPWMDVAVSASGNAMLRVLNIAQARPLGLCRTLPGGTEVRVFGVRARGGTASSVPAIPDCVEATSTTYIQVVNRSEP